MWISISADTDEQLTCTYIYSRSIRMQDRQRVQIFRAFPLTNDLHGWRFSTNLRILLLTINSGAHRRGREPFHRPKRFDSHAVRFAKQIF